MPVPYHHNYGTVNPSGLASEVSAGRVGRYTYWYIPPGAQGPAQAVQPGLIPWHANYAYPVVRLLKLETWDSQLT